MSITTEKIWLIPVAIIGVIALIFGNSILMAYPLMWCWNFVVPTMFGLSKITFWQMFCLNFLLTSFFKNNNIKY